MVVFKRRKSDTKRYERALSILDKVTFEPMRSVIESEIKAYDTESQLISLFVNNPNTIEVDYKGSKNGKAYELPIKVIAKYDNGFKVIEVKLVSFIVGENYVEEWRNVNNDYSVLRIPNNTGRIDYFYPKYRPLLLSQLQNQDKLEEMCDQLNLMDKNYFYLD